MRNLLFWRETANQKRLPGIWIPILFALAVLIPALIYRPYISCGQFICSEDYYSMYRLPAVILSPPAWDEAPQFDSQLYSIQIALILWTCLMAILLSQATGKHILPRLSIAIVGIALLETILILFGTTLTWLIGGAWMILAGLLLFLLGMSRRLQFRWNEKVPKDFPTIIRETVHRWKEELLLKR